MKERAVISSLQSVFLCVALVGSHVAAQQTSTRTIPAQDIERSAYELAGDSTAWPIIIHFAQRDADRNAFVLGPAALKNLRSFRTIHLQVRQDRELLRGHVGEGARIFATSELTAANDLLDRYNRSIRDEDPAEAERLSPLIREAVTTVGAAIKERRTEDIMAALVSREGSVDKRKGLLGRWNEAKVEDAFAPTDAVRTGSRSQAGLTFSDGVDVVVAERTTVVIRESRIDKLNQRVSRDVDLVNGSVLAKLTSAARDGGDLTMRAGPAASEVRSGRFWVEASQRREMRMSNYDGSISVMSNNVEVQLEKNQGTIAREGEAPMKPVALLPAPTLPWSSPDTVIGTSEISIAWSSINGAASYILETSTNRSFDGTLERRPVNGPNARLTNLPLGASYVRLAAIDRSGLRGIESPVHSVIRIEDRQPPAIILEMGDTPLRVTAKDRFIIAGTTERDATVTANGTPVSVAPDGSFRIPVDVSSSLVRMRIEARDRADNLSTKDVTLQRPDRAKLSAFSTNGRLDGKTLQLDDGRLQLQGVAYPGMAVTVTQGSSIARVLTASNGRWAITIDDISKGPWKVSMELLSENIIVYSETYEIR